jgi:hypothetical protein
MGDFTVRSVMGAAELLAQPGTPAQSLTENFDQTARTVGSNSYSKVYNFYSGSVVDRAKFMQDGYQNTFDWADHQFQYAEVVTTYEEIETYTAVSENNITLRTTSEFGEYVATETGDSDNVSTEYEWVRSEKNPTVETSWGNYQLYIVPGTMGIISESDSGYENIDTRSHESSYTDNGNLSFSQTTIGGSIVTTSAQEEADFINTLFGYDSFQSLPDMIDDFFNIISDDLFRTILADRDSFKSVQPQKLITSDIVSIAANESVETAIINPFVGVTDQAGEYTTTSAEESDAMAMMYSGPSWADYEDA